MILFGIISTIEQIGKIFCQPALIGVFHTREKATCELQSTSHNNSKTPMLKLRVISASLLTHARYRVMALNEINSNQSPIEFINSVVRSIGAPIRKLKGIRLISPTISARNADRPMNLPRTMLLLLTGADDNNDIFPSQRSR